MQYSGALPLLFDLQFGKACNIKGCRGNLDALRALNFGKNRLIQRMLERSSVPYVRYVSDIERNPIIRKREKDFSTNGGPRSSYCRNHCNLIITCMKLEPLPCLDVPFLLFWFFLL